MAASATLSQRDPRASASTERESSLFSRAVSTQSSFTAESVQSLSGRRFIVTGANSGIGLDAARIFASKGAHVILAVRSTDKGARAREQILAQHPDAEVHVRALDLASLASIKRFVDEYLESSRTLDVLVNNAGVMALPRTLTADGFEMQLGTNHLGHFALTARLFPALVAGNKPRVVTVSSLAHVQGRVNLDDLHGEKSYRKWGAYMQSKLANLFFAFELDRRARAASIPVMSLACHPGYSATNLQFVGPQMEQNSLVEGVMRFANRFMAQPAAMGCLPTVYAAVSDDVEGGDFIGPDGVGEIRGYPRKVKASARAYDQIGARRLWEASEAACKLVFDPRAVRP